MVRQRSARSRPPDGGGRDHPSLPEEIAFLREYGVRSDALEAAARAMRRQRVDAFSALLASGAVTDTLVYKSLAHLVDAPFRIDWPLLAPGADPLEAVRDGRVPLADGTWLLAPAGAALRLLIRAARRPDVVPRRLAITTPAHLEALVLRRAGGTLARRASLALPELEPSLSARGALDGRAVGVAGIVLVATIALFVVAPAILAFLVGAVFLATVAFRSIVCVAGWPARTALDGRRQLDATLPSYTVLVPLYQEAGMVRGLVRNLASLDYPPAKLEILLLVETDDLATSVALAATPKPPSMRVVIVPPGLPRTKPRALNVGLALARGALITVYDAEDRPDPDQLRKAAARFAEAPARLACLQGRLAIDDSGRLLPRLFALEYAALFDLYNVGLARLGLPVPLGGTSNHFRASALRDVGGWDAWNVTEDADLGLRLARFGHAVSVLDSTTREEAPWRLTVWMRQRRRWIKGWMQIALVLARDRTVRRDLGTSRSLLAGLMMVGLVIGPLATLPVLALVAWQMTHGQMASSAVTLVAVTLTPVAAIASTLWSGWAGLRARPAAAPASHIPLMLPYQLLIAVAAWGGLWDLAVRPYHWRKTPHGAAALSRSSRARPPRRRTEPPRSTPD